MKKKRIIKTKKLAKNRYSNSIGLFLVCTHASKKAASYCAKILQKEIDTAIFEETHATI